MLQGGSEGGGNTGSLQRRENTKSILLWTPQEGGSTADNYTSAPKGSFQTSHLQNSEKEKERKDKE